MTGLALGSSSLAGLSLAVWLYLAVARGGFWRGRENDRAMYAAVAREATARQWPRVVAVIPARNEAELIGQTTASLLAQTYPGELSVLVVDDHSDDGTAAIASAAAASSGGKRSLTVIDAPSLPPGWTGKLWALTQGVERADALDPPPEYLLLTDADVHYPPDAVTALVVSAEDDRLALSSLMVALRCESPVERAFIPAFVFFFQMIYPFAWVNDPGRRVAAAAGGCMLVRCTALRAAGGIASIRSEIIDDCALSARLKQVGPIRLSLSDRVQSLRPCPSFADIRRMVVRTAFAQLHFSVVGLTLVVAAMLLVFLAPVVLGVAAHDGTTRLLSLISWMLMVILYAPIARRYGVSVLWGIALPLVAATYLLLTIESAFQYGRGRGGVWKGRAQAPRTPVRGKGRQP